MSAAPSESSLALGERALRLPAFLPDATRGVVRCAGWDDVAGAGVRGVVVNAFHLSRAPGTEVVRRLGGVRAFAGFELAVFSDSGGFQVFSLAGQPEWSLAVSRQGLRWRKKGDEARTLTPEKSIRHQFDLGADALVALDHCTRPDAPRAEHEESVAHTLDWARRAKAEFDRICTERGRRPLFFGVVQGGEHPDLRRRCAEELAALGVDGFGFGGWPVGAERGLAESVQVVVECTPPGALLWGLGIGSPPLVARCVELGYRLFDCVLPTRDARAGRIFVEAEDGKSPYLYIDDDRWRRDERPLDPACDCATCARHSRAFLRHLREVRDPLADRLCTVHNLRFYTRLMERLGSS